MFLSLKRNEKGVITYLLGLTDISPKNDPTTFFDLFRGLEFSNESRLGIVKYSRRTAEEVKVWHKNLAHSRINKVGELSETVHTTMMING